MTLAIKNLVFHALGILLIDRMQLEFVGLCYFRGVIDQHLCNKSFVNHAFRFFGLCYSDIILGYDSMSS